MGPMEGPRPASSTPRQQAGAVDGSDGSVGWREGGTGEKWADEAPERRDGRETEGGTKTVDVGGGGEPLAERDSSSSMVNWAVGDDSVWFR